jgi:hypothetical protein
VRERELEGSKNKRERERGSGRSGLVLYRISINAYVLCCAERERDPFVWMDGWMDMGRREGRKEDVDIMR